ncbi:MAG TPA: hypothetical protein VF092_29880 [Longimicrobium sp.]
MNARTASALAVAFCAAALLSARPAAAQADTTAHDTSHAAHPATPPRRAHRDRNVLTQEDFASRNEDNAYAIVRALRPAWLRGSRGASSNAEATPVVVYRDDVKMGGESELRGIGKVQIREIRYLDAMAATQRYGMDHAGGAILVSTQ